MKNLLIIPLTFWLFLDPFREVFATELSLTCKSSFFSSFTIVQKGDNFFLDGIKYPDYIERKNDKGTLWATVRIINHNSTELDLITRTKNVKTNYISEIEVFSVNLKTLSFTEGYRKKRGSNKFYRMLTSSSGTCG